MSFAIFNSYHKRCLRKVHSYYHFTCYRPMLFVKATQRNILASLTSRPLHLHFNFQAVCYILSSPSLHLSHHTFPSRLLHSVHVLLYQLASGT
jgi:hypothetical protein